MTFEQLIKSSPMALFKSRAKTAPPEAQVTDFSDESMDVLRLRARRRLIGSTLLVLLAVFCFPLIFDRAPRPVAYKEVRLDVPEQEKSLAQVLPLEGARTPQTTQTAQTASTSATVASAATPAQTQPNPTDVPPMGDVKPGSESPVPVVEKAPEKPTNALPEQSSKDPSTKTTDQATERAPAAKHAERFVIQIGAFADADKVKELRGKLDKAGFKTYAQSVKTTDGVRTRVRIGPFATQEEAEKVLERVKALHLQAQLLKLQ